MENNHWLLITEDVLLRLPFKILVRCTILSKFYYKKIRSADFSMKYLKKNVEDNADRCLLLSTTTRSPTDFYLMCFNESDRTIGSERFINQPLPHMKKKSQVVGHCNGVLCLCSYSYQRSLSSFEFRTFTEKNIVESELALWNPSIQRFKTIPVKRWLTLPTSHDMIHRLSPSYGFGYNRRTNDYQVVQINQSVDLRTKTFISRVQIFNLGTQRWRRSVDLDLKYETFEVSRRSSEGKNFGCPFVKGHMHWLLESWRDASWVVLAFDVNNEAFFDFRTPAPGDSPFTDISLTSLGDSLLFLSRHELKVDVWRMTEHKNDESWIVFYRVEASTPATMLRSLFPLLSSKTGDCTLYLANQPNRFMFWVDSAQFKQEVPSTIDTGRAFRGIHFIRSFELADGERILEE